MIEPGTTLFQRFEVERELGSRTVRAVDQTNGETVAVKVVDPGCEPEVRRQATRLVGLPRVRQICHEPARTLVVYDFIMGLDLATEIGHPEPMPTALVLERFFTLLELVETLHDQGMTHGDIKPANLLTDLNHQFWLVDWGASPVETLNNARVLNGFFGSPEMWQGKVTARSDQYALAQILAFMLTGEPPIPTHTPDLSHYGPNLTSILGRALAQRPEQRYPELGRLRAHLLEVQRGLAQISPPNRK